MGQKNRIKDIECATAQAILDKKGINKINSFKLAEMLQINAQRAGRILRRLQWEHSRDRVTKLAVWKRSGTDKVFAYQQYPRIKRRAAKLGVDLDDTLC